MSGGVFLAAPRFFCAGVDRAIEIVERLLEQPGAPSTSAIRSSTTRTSCAVSKGSAPSSSRTSRRSPKARSACSPRTASPRGEGERGEARSPVVDATCPLVNKVHAEARRYADSGHLVALVGHANHVEVIGTLGERPGSTVVIERPSRHARSRPTSRRGDHADDAVARRCRADRRRARREPGHLAGRTRTTSATRRRTARTP